ncbi:MAG: hypothetical protein JXR83_22160 [Deltaproteobacteria bacterium]|nr:hypothetical protein [Deltaproteobacteria bacterium]
MPTRIENQARAIVLTQALMAQLEASLAPTSQGGKAITGAEAQQIIDQAQLLPKQQLNDLKNAILDRLTATDHWDCTTDARAAFASFLGVPPEKLPAAVELQPGMNAMSRKVQNEAPASSVPKREFSEIIKGTEGLPEELRRTVTASLLGMQKDGRLRLDPDSRKLLTRAVVESYGEQGPDAYLAYRANSDLHAGSASSYLAEVLASGGSFEEILFAFLLLMADKAEKNALEKMEELARIEEGRQRGGSRPLGAGAPDLDARTGVEPHPDGSSRPGSSGKTGRGDGPQRVARTLEAIVQVAHHATTEKSEQGTNVTAGEAAKLVGYLNRLPPEVQKLLGTSFESALQVGMPMTSEAHAAIAGWCETTLGRPVDLGSAPPPGVNNWQDSTVCRRLQSSSKLEDQIALYVINTLYQPDKGLKEKFKPFRALRDQVVARQTAIDTELPADVGAQLDAASPTADSGAQPAPAKSKKRSAAAPRTAEPEAAPVPPEAVPVPPADDQAAAKPVRDPASDEISRFFSSDERGAGAGRKSDVRAQHELQIAINERQRVFEMLSNMMKAIHEMQMTSIRNLR